MLVFVGRFTFILNILSTYIYVRILCAHLVPRKGILATLKLELEVFVSCHVGAGNEARSSERATSANY